MMDFSKVWEGSRKGYQHWFLQSSKLTGDQICIWCLVTGYKEDK